MPTPFPGMDPYLERRSIWREVHLQLIAELARRLNPILRPRYWVATEQYTYTVTLLGGEEMMGMPDAMVVDQGWGQLATPTVTSTVATPVVAELPMPQKVVERYLEVHDAQTKAVITAIEILSPTNKLIPDARQQYERKRLTVLGSKTHFVEIDLLRRGEPMAMHLPAQTTSDYRIVISRAEQRPHADVYLIDIRQPIPLIPIPLRPGDREPTVDLNGMIHELYDVLSYDLRIDYRGEASPPLVGSDAEWADALLRAAELRP